MPLICMAPSRGRDPRVTRVIRGLLLVTPVCHSLLEIKGGAGEATNPEGLVTVSGFECGIRARPSDD